MQSNPFLNSTKRILIYVFIWLIITLIYIQILYFGEGISIKTAVADGVIFNFLLAGFGLSYWHSVKYISIESNSLLRILTIHLFGSLISVGLWLALGFVITNMFSEPSKNYSAFFMDSLGWRIIVGLLFYFSVVSFYYLIIYYNSFREKIIKENELKNLITEAELKSLKFQINPHFIFNSLNSMSALTTIDPEKAQKMILKLAEFLRYTLANNEQQKNKLSEELNNIKLYLEIEKIRFEDKFEFIEDVSQETRDKLVPNMILQPLFENAIKHAVYESLQKVTLKFKSFINNNFLNLTLENNFDSEMESKSGSGIGLKNINERLKLIYGLNNLLVVEKSKNMFRVSIFIPLNAN